MIDKSIYIIKETISPRTEKKSLHGKVRTLKDMSPEEKKALEKKYNCKIIPRDKNEEKKKRIKKKNK